MIAIRLLAVVVSLSTFTHVASGQSGLPPVPPLTQREILQLVEDCKFDLKTGMTHAQVAKIVKAPVDKVERYRTNQKLVGFDVLAQDGDTIVRFFPFEVPGSETPRYRANLLFDRQGRLLEWYFRAP